MEAHLEASRATMQKERNQRFRIPRIRDRIRQPEWMRGAPNPLLHQIRDQKLLLNCGSIVWGRIIQANVLLFKPGPSDHPAAVAFSEDPYFDSHPDELAEIARSLYDQKGLEQPDPRLAEFARIITDEHELAFNLPIPSSSGRLVLYTTTLVVRDHLPNRMLSDMAFPYLVIPAVTPASMILPCEYWPEELASLWLDG